MASNIQDPVATDYVNNGQAVRVNTDLTVLKSLQINHPGQEIIIVPETACNILAFAKSGQAIVYPDPSSNGTPNGPIQWHLYNQPTSRLDGSLGSIETKVFFGKYIVNWNNRQFHLYLIDGRDSDYPYAIIRNQYIIASTTSDVESLVLAAGSYSSELHGEIFVYDQGFWSKDAQLWKSIQKSSWENVILDEKMKKGLIDDVSRFYDNRSTYERLGVPWKRGLIFHGPPGNGKTISIKATMHMLYDRKDAIPTLYVKSLANFGGPERSLNDIFTKARLYAPCYLVFEDLDSLVTDSVRSFFLNQVDGLASNDGILMVGSTNHLERLDPGISKRPSRFDRKYLFPNPNFDQRVQYAEFWRHKVLKNNEKSADEGNNDNPIEFPEEMCKAVAEITDEFSFAYMQEAFLASLLQLAIGSEPDDDSDKRISPSNDFFMVSKEGIESAGHPSSRLAENSGDKDELEKYILWREFQKQVKILRDQIGNDDDSKRSSTLPPPVTMGMQLAVPKRSIRPVT